MICAEASSAPGVEEGDRLDDGSRPGTATDVGVSYGLPSMATAEASNRAMTEPSSA
jgi:hypothetical protein